MKIGALVMIIANKAKGGDLIYCNGDLGELVDVQDRRPVVKLQRTGQGIVVDYVTRLHEEISDSEKKVVGSIFYAPLRLAWASTVHRSQGLTVDSAQIDFRSKFYRNCPHMLYVALSRCRSKEGLRLIGSPRTFVQNCTVNEKVRRFL